MQKKEKTMAIKEEFKKTIWTDEDERLLQLLRKKKAQRLVKVKDIVAPRFRWLQGNHDRGNDKLKEVDKSTARSSVYGYGGFLVPVKHPKYREMMTRLWNVFESYVPQTKLVKGAPMHPKR